MNAYASPYDYLRWLPVIREEMNKKQFIQENVTQNVAAPDYVHRNPKSTESITRPNAKGYKSLKEAVLVSIQPKQALESLKEA